MAVRGEDAARGDGPVVPGLAEAIPVRIIFDNNLPRALSRALGLLHEPVAHLQDFLPHDVSDLELLAWAGSHGVCVISRDTHISRRKHEKAAVLDNDVGIFYLLPGGTPPNKCKMVQTLIRHWPAIKLAARGPRPFIYEIRERGGVRRYDGPRAR